MASARTWLRKQTASTGILLFHTILLHVPSIKTKNRVSSRCVHVFGTCKNDAAARWRLLTASWFLQVPKKCIDLNPTILYIAILGTCSKIAQKNKMLALAACFSQPCEITFGLLLTNSFVSTKMKPMECFVY